MRPLKLFSLTILLSLLIHSSPPECWRCHVGNWLDIPPRVHAADAIVVLGGSPGERLPIAVKLFQQGLAPEFWYTGAAEDAQQGEITSTQLTVQQAQAMGIPATALTLLATTNTWEDAEQIAATARARGIHSILVVTSWYHGRRALCAIHHELKDTDVEVY